MRGHIPRRWAENQAPVRRRGSGGGRPAVWPAAGARADGCCGSYSVFLDRDDDADFLAGSTAKVVVPAGQVVILRVDGGELGGVILAFVPQIDLQVVGGLIPGIAREDRGRTHLIDLHRHQLDHGFDRAGGLLTDGQAAGQHRVLDGGGVAGGAAVDVADVGGTAPDEAEDLLEGGAGDGRDLPETDAQQGAGVAGQAVPRRAQDVAADDAPQDLAGGRHQQAGHFLHGGGGRGAGAAAGAGIRRCPRRAAGRGTGAGRRGRMGRTAGRAAGRTGLLKESGDVGGEVLDIVQHAIAPQIAGDVIEDQPVDLPFFIGGEIADIRRR